MARRATKGAMKNRPAAKMRRTNQSVETGFSGKCPWPCGPPKWMKIERVVADFRRLFAYSSTERLRLSERPKNPSRYAPGSSNSPICSAASAFAFRFLSGLPTTPSTSTPIRAARGTKTFCRLP